MPELSFLTRRLYENRSPDRVIVLMYHGTSPSGQRPSSRYSTTASRFLEQIDLISTSGWCTGLMSELSSGTEASTSKLYITFDDGFADNFAGAFVPMVERGLKGTWYIVAGEGKNQADWLKNQKVALMSQAQIKELSDAGMEIGSHSESHPHLEKLDSESLEQELSGSKKRLEDLLGRPVNSFAYPFGTFNNTVLDAVEKTGFKTACTTRPGFYNHKESPFEIRRVTIYEEDSLETFARKLVFAANDVSNKEVLSYYINRIKSRLRI